MTCPDSSPGVNRRSVVAGSAWGVPAIIAATSAPAFAASRCAGGFNKHSWTVGWYGLTGIVGYVNDAHSWIKALETPTPPGCRPDQAIDNYGIPRRIPAAPSSSKPAAPPARPPASAVFC